ncbi:MAG: beta strand repeat-containing protein [Opitutaceae bacterium]
MNKITQTTSLLAAGLLVGTLTAQTTYTWDPDGNQTSDGGAGTWDTATSNWDDNGSAPNTIWVDGYNAAFGDSGAAYQVDLTSAGVTVGDLTYAGGNTLEFRGATAAGSLADAITVNSGGATWDTGGGQILFYNVNNNNNTRLAMTSGDTLTINGGGTFHTGVNPQNNVNGTWGVSGAILDVTGTTTVRGDNLTVGQFATVKMADGSRFIHERDTDRTFANAYANDWVLGAGTVTFDNGKQRNYHLSGDISGAGGLKAEFMANRALILTGTNTFTGGVEVSTSSIIQVYNAGSLGDAANGITLVNGGILRLNGVDLGSTRDILLSGTGGSIVNDSAANEFGGKITGDGNFQIGNALFNTLSNRFKLTSDTSDYTGSTTIHNGSLELGINNAIPSGTVLTIGGNASTAQMFMEGFDLEIAGLVSTGGNTKQFSSTAASILTINVADGETHSYNGNVVGTAGNVSILKTGLGTQNFNRASGNTSFIGGISANAGTLLWDVNGNSGAVSVASGATLLIGNSGTSGGVGTGVGAANAGDANIANEGSLSILRSAAFAYDGVISGAGDATFTAGNGAVTLSQVQTYTGNTTIDKAVLTAQMVNALSADSAVFLGAAAGGGTSVFEMNGFDQEIGGLAIVPGTHTRAVDNNGLGTDVTLTINVATGESYAFNANVRGTDTISIVKSGDGTQTINRFGGYTTPLGDLTVTAGELIWSTTNPAALTGAVDVTGGNLEVTESLSVTNFTLATGATSSFVFEVTDWAGVAQTDFNQVAASGTFSVADAASYTVVVDDANLTGFVDSTQSFIIATAPTMSATTAEFGLDATAFTLGSGGTWSLDVVGTDVVLTFTSTAVTGYAAWSGGADFDVDTNGDGVDNGLAFLLGAADVNANAIDLLPTSTESGGDLVMTFSVLNAANRGTAELAIEHSNDLTGLWSTATTVPETSSTVDDIVFAVTPDGDMNDVIATIPSTKAAGGKLFGRVVGTNP